MVLAIASPTLEGGAVEEDDITVLVHLEVREVDLGGIHDHILGNIVVGGNHDFFDLGGRRFLAAASGQQEQGCNCCNAEKDLFHIVLYFSC